MSTALVLFVLASMDGSAAQRFWAWTLTGLQVLAMWVAGSGRRFGWILGAGVQPAWVAYALLTGQEGFVLGCVVSATVQLSNALRSGRFTAPTSPRVKV